MADRIKIVNTVGGGDYASITTALSMEPDFAAGEDNIVFKCYGGLDTGRINIAAGKFTTSSAHRVKVMAMDKCLGLRNQGYRIVGAWGAFTGAVYSTLEWFECYDLSISNSSASGYGVRMAKNDTLDRCLIYDVPRYGITTATGGFFYIMNCIIEHSGTSNVVTSSGLTGSDGNYLYNCVSTTSSGQGFVVNNNSKAFLYNCYSGGNTGQDISVNAGGILTKLTTYTEDGTQGTPTLAYSTSSGVYYNNVTIGSEDCHLNSASSGLFGVGTDLSSDPIYPITVDFDGYTRPVSPTVGAFEWLGGASKIYYYMMSIQEDDGR